MPDITVSINFTLPSDEVASKVNAFLKIHPNVEVDESGELIYTDVEWVKEFVRRKIESWVNAIIHEGLKKIASDGADLGTDIEVTVE